MAVISPTDHSGDSAEGQEKLKDEFVDLQYAKPSTTLDQFAEEPWEHCHDPASTYLSLRVDDQPAFFDRLELSQQNHVRHELCRIQRLRKRFDSNRHNQGLMQDLIGSKAEWKAEVGKSAGDLIKEAQRFIYQIDKNEMSAWLDDSAFCQAFYRRYSEMLSPDLPGAISLKQRKEMLLNELAPTWRPHLYHKYERRIMAFQRLKNWETNTMGTSEEPTLSALGRVSSYFQGRNHIKAQPTQSPSAVAAEQDTQAGTTQGSMDTEDDVELEPLYGLKANAMFFKKAKDKDTWVGRNSDHRRYTGHFPNQKISMHEILHEPDDNPLRQECSPDEIRYFHFPTNNMSWIETAIARYYSEEPQPIDDRQPYDPHAGKTEKLLAREFWRGQMHGSGGALPVKKIGDWTKRGAPVHARHMRSRCSIIPRDPGPSSQDLSSNPPSSPGRRKGLQTSSSFPLQLPFKEKNIALFLPYLHWETSSRRAKMVQVVNEEIGCKPSEPKLNKLVERITLEGGVQKPITDGPRTQRPNKSKYKPPKYKRLLGAYLMAVARVVDQMDYCADEALLRDYVKADPPLHIRRTLDQYYFATLDDTSQRDKDQVVYRGTKAGQSLHSHGTRVVMVDQLWLWILDDNTIITSFPRRWGRNKPDPSGVHKSLRERLETRREEIKSVHHLALIIIDQCSRVFFDRTKPLDQRPEVMDLFAAAIGHVTEMTSIAYGNFWRHTALHAGNMLPKSKVGNRYLDINPEGVLFKEAQDIAEELKIMKNIYTEQLQVVKDFKRHIQYPLGKIPKHGEVSAFKRLLLELTGNQAALDDHNNASSDDEEDRAKTKSWEGTLLEAEGTLELIESRHAEIQDLEDSALRTCQQLEGLLSLKQQQASIVEAKAALQRADESIKQGRAVMAFTIVTIFFLPLGFFAAFFGMNNADINDAPWMSLREQIGYMFGLSTIVITISISIAFSPWIGGVVRIAFKILYRILDEHTQIDSRITESLMNRDRLEQITNRWLQDRKNRRFAASRKNEEQANPVPALYPTASSSSDSSSSSASRAPPDSNPEHPDASWWHNGMSALRRGKQRVRGMV